MPHFDLTRKTPDQILKYQVISVNFKINILFSYWEPFYKEPEKVIIKRQTVFYESLFSVPIIVSLFCFFKCLTLDFTFSRITGRNQVAACHEQ